MKRARARANAVRTSLPIRRAWPRVPAIAWLIAAGLALRVLISQVLFPGQGLGSDLHLFTGWASTLAEHGPGGFYGNAGFADYPPGYLWVLWLLGEVGAAVGAVTGQPASGVVGGLLKIPAILADLGIAAVLYRTARGWRDERAGLWAAGLFLFVPVTWYDSALWGQVDSVGSLLLLGAVVLVIAGRARPAVALAVLATTMKPQYAIGLIVVAAVLARRHVRALGGEPPRNRRAILTEVGAEIAVAMAVGFAVILPFDLPARAAGSIGSVPILGSVAGLLAVLGSATEYYAVLTVNAFNGWAFVGPTPLTGALGTDLRWTSDSLPVLGIPAVHLGAVAFLVLVVLVVATLAMIDDRRTVVLAFTVLAVGFFVLPTRVHERYLFPAFATGALLAASSVRWRWWYIGLGIANVANLHAILTLPYPGYGTPPLHDLPLAALVREPVVVGLIADAHLALFAVLVAAVARLAWPLLRARALRGLSSRPPLHQRARVEAVPARLEGRGWLAIRSGFIRSWRAAARGAVTTATRPDAPLAATTTATRLDRRDLGAAILIAVVVLSSRVYRLEMPRTMYFDERWHATSAAEFLQDWRYGLPATLSEWTHPHLAKYLMAAGEVVFGAERASSVGELGAPVRDAALEPAFFDSTSPRPGGDRILVATGEELLVLPHGDLSAAHPVPIAGAAAVAVDGAGHRAIVGTELGELWSVTSAQLDALIEFNAATEALLVTRVDGPVRRVWSVGVDRVLALVGPDRLVLIDTPTGRIAGTANVPGLNDVLVVPAAGRAIVVAADPVGLILLGGTDLSAIARWIVDGGVTGLDLVDGSDQLRRERDLLERPTIYAATGRARMTTLEVDPAGLLSPRADFPMPGGVTTVRWDRPTNLIHVLGRTPDGAPTIYVVEPHGNAVFADARLGFEPAAWILDVEPADPALDRERAIAFSARGGVATVDVGSHAFAWRVPGVIAGAATAVLLYVLARLLFRRRTVGLLAAGFVAIDGLLFQQSRIAMNDVYVGLFAMAAFVFLAVLLRGGTPGRAALARTILGLPALGVVLGLALAAKWVGAYALGGVLLIILSRTPLGRRLLVVAAIVLTAILGGSAIRTEPGNVTFLAIMLAVTAAVVAVAARDRKTADHDADLPAWADPAARHGLPFAAALACIVGVALAVYVLSYVPWALSTAGGPQLVAGWPPGHAGQTFVDLQAQMYRYHDELREAHGAGSPWSAWPLDLKPLWGYLETAIDGSQMTVLGAGNPVLAWLSAAAVGWACWTGWRRRSPALGFVAVAFLSLWLPWARIERVTFNYHYSAALPFALLLLAAFLTQLWAGASGRTWLLARAAAAAVIVAPASMWLLVDPLCTVAGVPIANPASPICGAATSSLVPALAGLVVSVGVAWILLRGATPRGLAAAVVIAAVVVSLVLYPALSAWPLPAGWPEAYQRLLPTWDSTFQFLTNQAPGGGTTVVGVQTLLVGAMAVAVAWVVAWGRGWRPSGVAGQAAERVAAVVGGMVGRVPDRFAGRFGGRLSGGIAGRLSGGIAGRLAGGFTGRLSGRLSATRARSVGARWARSPLLWLVLASLTGALVADRFAGPDGPWLWNLDLPLANYPFAVYLHDAVTQGTLPFWNDRVGMGFPLYAEGQIGALYPPNWLIFQLPPLVALDVARILHLVLAGVGAGSIVLRLSGSRAGAITTALGAVLCGAIVAKLQWTQVVTVYGWMPWVLLPLLWRRPGPGAGAVALSGALWGVQALGGHPPYWVITGMAALTVLLTRLPVRLAIRRPVAFGIVGIGVGAVQLVPTILLTTLSWRADGLSPDALFEYAATPFDILAIAFGRAFFGADGDVFRSWYPGGSVWSTLEVYAYIGLPALALAIVGLRGRATRPIVGLALLAVAIPILGVLRPEAWAAMPGLNGLRHPIRAYLLLDLAIAIGAGLGVARLGRRRPKADGAGPGPAVAVAIPLGFYILVAIVVLALPAAFEALVPVFWPTVPPSQAAGLRALVAEAMVQPLPVVLEALAGLLAVLLVARADRLRLIARRITEPRILGVRFAALRLAALVLVALPLAAIAPQVNRTLPASAFSLEGSTLAASLRAIGPRQVLTIDEPFYQGFPTAMDPVARDPHVYTSQFGLSLRLAASERVLADLRAAGPGSPLVRAMGIDTIVSFGATCAGDHTSLVASDSASGASICRVRDPLAAPYWLPASAVLASIPPGAPGAPSEVILDPTRVVAAAHEAQVTDWSDRHAAFEVTAPFDGYLFVDRTWWPAWRTTVDGRPAAVERAWGAQLVPLAAGQHRIEQEFVPWDVQLGLLISLVALGAVGGWAWLGRRATSSRSPGARPIPARADREGRLGQGQPGVPAPAGGVLPPPA